MKNSQVSIIIPSRNLRDDLRKCLMSIFENYGEEKIEVIVSDNNSKDGSIEMVTEHFPWVRVCASSCDINYPAAVNIGIEAAHGTYLLLLDSDVIIQKKTIEELLHFLKTHPVVGVAVSKMFYPDGSVQMMARRFPTPMNSLFGRESMLTKLFPHNKISKHYLMIDELSGNEPFEVDWASAACMMVKKEVIAKVGLLDEGFLMYWSDADWCRRISANGWKICCIPAAAVVHDMKNESNKKKSLFAIKAFHQGAYRYFRKYYIKTSLHPLHLFAIIALSGRAMMQIILNFLKSDDECK